MLHFVEHSWAAFHSEVAPPSYGLYRLLGSFGRLGLYLCVGASFLCDPHTRFAPYALARPLLTYTWLLGAPSTAVATAGPSGFSVPAPWRVKGLRRRRFPPLVRRGATGRPDGHLGRRARPGAPTYCTQPSCWQPRGPLRSQRALLHFSFATIARRAADSHFQRSLAKRFEGAIQCRCKAGRRICGFSPGSHVTDPFSRSRYDPFFFGCLAPSPKEI